ncbi:hypothetical protein EDB80DRAFT_770158 [Ilyonectria destructans]|nr:hypothetical protein EDB80DRAFT_770158 [Ilyonectria destructans]
MLPSCPLTPATGNDEPLRTIQAIVADHPIITPPHSDICNVEKCDQLDFLSRLEILAWFGVSLHIRGLADQVGRASSHASNDCTYARATTSPGGARATHGPGRSSPDRMGPIQSFGYHAGLPLAVQLGKAANFAAENGCAVMLFKSSSKLTGTTSRQAMSQLPRCRNLPLRRRRFKRPRDPGGPKGGQALGAGLGPGRAAAIAALLAPVVESRLHREGSPDEEGRGRVVGRGAGGTHPTTLDQENAQGTL